MNIKSLTTTSGRMYEIGHRQVISFQEGIVLGQDGIFVYYKPGGCLWVNACHIERMWVEKENKGKE